MTKRIATAPAATRSLLLAIALAVALLAMPLTALADPGTDESGVWDTPVQLFNITWE